MPEDPSRYFELFNEIGIIEQLSRADFEARLPKGVLVSHFGVLNHLIRVGDGRTPLELARAFQVPKTTMTHTLAGLEKRKWVETRPNPEDLRRLHLADAVPLAEIEVRLHAHRTLLKPGAGSAADTARSGAGSATPTASTM